jgi:hypothetical protein
MRDDPRVAGGPGVLSEVARQRGRRQNTRQPNRRRVIVGAVARGEAQRSLDAVADAGRARAAVGKACRQFFAPEGDWEVPSGFAKNGDTIAIFIL